MPPSRRAELVDAAMKVFHSRGFHGTSIDVVLEECGVSRMTLYNHFKSKDELIVAALRRRDEVFRNRMMKFVDNNATTPIGRVLAVFDYHEQWVSEKDFCGCMFINAAAEYHDSQGQIRSVSAIHKLEVLRYLVEQCKAAELKNSKALAEKLNLLLDGAIVTAQVVGQVGYESSQPADAVRSAKQIAEILIEQAQ